MYRPTLFYGRWIRLKLGSFDRSSLKREAWWFFKKIHPSPIPWEPFKDSAPSHTLTILHLMAKCAVRQTPLRLHLWFYIVQGLANMRWKNLVSIANWGVNFFYRHLSFFTLKAALNVNCAMVLTKRFNFFFFQLSIAEGYTFFKS